HMVAGGMLALLAVFADPLLGRPREWGAVESVTLAAGVIVAAAGLVLRGGRVADRAAGICLSIIVLMVTVVAAEGAVRILDIDIVGQEHAWRKMAPFYRQPTVPTGDVFFRRDGPKVWTGQVINTQMKLYRVTPNPYVDEPVITVRYDSLGFRAAGDLDDWEIAIAGDSFTELGSLTDDQLHSTIMGRRLGVRVRNLGVSQTGPLTHLHYLQAWGVAPSTRHVVIAFFEGNDLWDLRDEFRALARRRATGEREYREIEGDASILRALDGVWQAYRRPAIGPDSAIQAWFRGRDGDVPVTLAYAPESSADVLGDGELLAALDYFFDRYADFARQAGVTPWLAYMPVKLRAAHGLLRFPDPRRGMYSQWEPTDLPDFMAEYAARHGIRFVDLAPALAAATARTGELPYATIYDTHLNALGAAVVARELARRMGEAVGGSR
ncbi:MAG TPA: hypothetical protein VK936_06745, partial [Longimicrobiales bacterium]|nr:hypothetical protein [Longimicrobiales bacterium]